MDNRAERMFFDLLREAMWGCGVRPELYEGAGAAEWQIVLDTAVRQTVTGHIFDALSALPAGMMPPRDVRMKLLIHTDNIERFSARAAKVTAEVAAMYAREGLDCVLLKGLAAAAAYPVPEHRIQGDVDFYFPAGECERAQKLLFGGRTDNMSHDERHYHETYRGILVENHSELTHFPGDRYAGLERDLNAMLKERMTLEIDGMSVATPSPEFNVLFMLEHAAFHLPDVGLGLRHLCDWARQLWFYRDKIDRDRVAGVIRRYGFGRVANAFGLICVQRLGMPEELFPGELSRSRRARRDADYVLRVIMDGGNFGRHFGIMKSSQRHWKLARWPKKVVSLLVFLRNRRKYRIVGDGLFGTIFRENLKRTFSGR